MIYVYVGVDISYILENRILLANKGGQTDQVTAVTTLLKYYYLKFHIIIYLYLTFFSFFSLLYIFLTGTFSTPYNYV